MYSKLSKYFSNKYVKLVIFLRLAGYIVIPFYPLEGIILSMILDIVDWHLLSWGNVPKEVYHRIDKPIDYIQYLVMILPLLNTIIIVPYLLFLVWRTIGQIVYSFSKFRWIFIIFPNIAEYLALLYLLNIRFELGINVLSIEVILLLVAIKIAQEVWLHYLAKGNSYGYASKLRAILYRKS